MGAELSCGASSCQPEEFASAVALMWAFTDTMVTHTLLKVPGAMAPDAVPVGTAQDGGSLRETFTVPVAGVSFMELPPPQLMTTKATAMTRVPSKSETGWRFTQSRA